MSTAAGACWSAARSTATSPTRRSTRWPSPGRSTTGTAATPASSRSGTRSASSSPSGPSTATRDVRLKVMDEQGLAGALLFPTLGVGIEDALKHDPEAAGSVFRAFNRWLADDWGYRYQGRLFAVPYVPLLDPAAAAEELARVVEAGAVAVNVRSAPVPVPGRPPLALRPRLRPVLGAGGRGRHRGGDARRHRGLRRPRADVGAGRGRELAVPLAAARHRDQGPGGERLLRGGALPQGVRALPGAAPGQRRERCVVGARPAPPARRRRQPQPGLLRRPPPRRRSASTCGSPRSGRTTWPA